MALVLVWFVKGGRKWISSTFWLSLSQRFRVSQLKSVCLLGCNTVRVAVIAGFGIWDGDSNSVLEYLSFVNWTSFHLPWDKRWLKAVSSVGIWLEKIGCKWLYPFASVSNLLWISWWGAWYASNFCCWGIALLFKLGQSLEGCDTVWITIKAFIWICNSFCNTILQNSPLVTWA